MTQEPIWIQKTAVLSIHDELIRLYGGSFGVRDEWLLESALGKPMNLFHYENADIFTLAASYIIGIAKNHPFVDGNKRTAFVTGGTFLEINGLTLDVSQDMAVEMMVGVADGSVEPMHLTPWLEKWCEHQEL